MKKHDAIVKKPYLGIKKRLGTIQKVKYRYFHGKNRVFYDNHEIPRKKLAVLKKKSSNKLAPKAFYDFRKKVRN